MGLVLPGLILPDAELTGETYLGSAIKAGGGEDVALGAVADACAYLAEGVYEGYVFKRLDGWEAAGEGIDAGGAG